MRAMFDKGLTLRSALDRLLLLCFPPKCIGCSAYTENPGAFCHKCWANITFINAPCCQTCGVPFEFEIDEEIACAQCVQHVPHFNRARSLGKHDGALRDAIHRMKYKDQTHIAKHLAHMLHTRRLFDLSQYDHVIPVPMHASKLRLRLYNQAALLALHLCKFANLPGVFSPNFLRSTGARPAQKTLTASQRRDSVAGAFTLNCRTAENARALIVDDVFTTGSTVGECAAVLKRGGFARVDVLTVTRVL